jgi:hypothetical protein
MGCKYQKNSLNLKNKLFIVVHGCFDNPSENSPGAATPWYLLINAATSALVRIVGVLQPGNGVQVPGAGTLIFSGEEN